MRALRLTTPAATNSLPEWGRVLAADPTPVTLERLAGALAQRTESYDDLVAVAVRSMWPLRGHRWPVTFDEHSPIVAIALACRLLWLGSTGPLRRYTTAATAAHPEDPTLRLLHAAAYLPHPGALTRLEGVESAGVTFIELALQAADVHAHADASVADSTLRLAGSWSSREPDQCDPWFYAARALAGLGRHDEAAQAISTALDLLADDPDMDPDERLAAADAYARRRGELTRPLGR